MKQKAEEIVGVVLVVMIILLPFGWILLSHEPAGPFTAETSIEMVKEAMTSAGLTLCSEKTNTWDVPGALGGTTYTISSDCGALDQSPGVTVHVQKFETEDARNAMIRGFNSQTRGKPNGVLLTRGPYVVLVQGHGHSEIASMLKEKLQLT